jgi:hypothetical protein
MPKTYISKNLTLGDESPKVMWAPMGKLVPQLIGVEIFLSDLCFMCVIAYWKGIFKNYELRRQTMTPSIILLWR